MSGGIRFSILIIVLVTTGCIDAAATLSGSSDPAVGSMTLHSVPEIAADFPGETVDEPYDVMSEWVDAAQDLEVADTPVDVGETLDSAESVEEIDLDVASEVCLPDCAERECGSDGCDGLCGLCPDTKPVCSFGLCQACAKDCVDKECGSDGCGGSCGACPETFLCVQGACQPPACAPQSALYEDAFEHCSQGQFDIVDFESWDDVTWWGVTFDPYSAPCSLYLGDLTTRTYDTGERVHLVLVSPPVSLPSGVLSVVKMRLLVDLEPVPSPLYPYDYDVLYLFADIVGGEDSTASEAVYSTKELLNDTGGVYVPVAVGLYGLEGRTIRLRFVFDTLDSVDNGHFGVLMDDLSVEVMCPFCSNDGHCDDGDPCTQDTCVEASSKQGFGACFHEVDPLCCVGAGLMYCDDSDPCTVDICNANSGLCEHVPIDCEP